MRKAGMRMTGAAAMLLLSAMWVGPAAAQDDTYPPDPPSDDIVGDTDTDTDTDDGGTSEGSVAGSGAADEPTDSATDGGSTSAGEDAAAAGDDDGGTGSENLAFTGNDFSVPMAVGAALVGVGALLYLAAANRRLLS